MDRLVEVGILLLVVLTPLAMGSVSAKSLAALEAGCFLVFGAWLLKGILERKFSIAKGPILIFPALLISIAVVQLLPLPLTLLKLVSPNVIPLHPNPGTQEPSQWLSLSIVPYATKEEFFRLLSAFAVFIVVASHYTTKERVRRLFLAIVCTGFFIAVFAVLQKLAWNGKLFWVFPMRPGITPNMTNVWGPYINHNHFAGYMEMAIPLAVGLLLYRLSAIRTLPGVPLKRRLIRLSESREFFPLILLSLATLIMAGTLFMTLSRGGIIGFSVSAVFLSILAFKSRILKKKAAFMILIGLLLLALLVVLSSGSRLEGRFMELGEEGKISRVFLWKDSVNLSKDFPLLGTGFGTFKFVYPRYQSAGTELFFGHAENDYLETLTDSGIVGLALVLSMVCFFFYVNIKRWLVRHDSFVKCVSLGGLASCVAITVHGLTDFNMRIPANMLHIVIIAGVTTSALFNLSHRASRRSEK